MEVDPLFIGPAALAKAYRFVGDPRDAQQFERLKDLAEDPHGIYDCTHCFKCIEACPKGVAPMSQIMRLRRRAGDDHDINDRNNGKRHEKAFVSLVKDNGLLWEAELLPRSYGGNSFFGKFAPPSALELVDSLPVDHQGAAAPQGHAGGRAQAPQDSPRTTSSRSSGSTTTVEGRDERFELNLYISATTRTSGPTTTSSRRSRRRRRRREGSAPDEGRLLARLREPRLHPRAARLDGEGRAAARHRARRARPRVLHAAPASSPSTTRSWPTR